MYTRCVMLVFVFLVVVNAQSLLPSFTYNLVVSYVGFDFLGNFSWETADDPTHGRVNYVNKATALQDNLTFGMSLLSRTIYLLNFLQFRTTSSSCALTTRRKLQNLPAGETAYAYNRWMPTMTPCSSSMYLTCPRVVQRGLHGGQRVRKGPGLTVEKLISSKASISVHGILPRSTPHRIALCQRFDYREGSIFYNRYTYHSLKLVRRSTESTSCDTSVNYNQGCGVSFPEQDSYGEKFNAVGGGFYIMEKSSTKGISVWFITRDSFLLLGGEPSLDLVLLSIPDAYFPTSQNCDYSKHFNAHNIIFDLTLCVSIPSMFCGVLLTYSSILQGDWAGSESVWNASTCAAKASTCESCKPPFSFYRSQS